MAKTKATSRRPVPVVSASPVLLEEAAGTNNRIKKLRQRSRLTQKELALLVGLDETSVSRHESGHRALSADQIAKYASVFKVQSHELFIDVPNDSSTSWEG